MRILMLANTFPPQRYGISKHVLHLAVSLADLDQDVDLIVPTSGPPGVRFPKRMRVRKYGTFGENRTLFGLTMFQKSLQTGSQRQVIHAHMLAPAGLVASWLSRLYSIPYVITVHGWSQLPARPTAIRDQYSGVYFSLLRRGLRSTLLNADRLIAVSRFMAELLVKSGADPRKIDVLGSGVDTDELEQFECAVARRRLGIDIQSKVVLTVARLSAEKGQHLLIEAIPDVLRPFPETKFIFCGDGPDREALRKEVARLGLERSVFFKGFVSAVEKKMYYAACDLFAYPALADPFSQAPLEAMAAAKPVVAFDVAGCRDLVRDGITGKLVRPYDVPEFADAIVECLGNSDLRTRQGENGRNVVATELSWKTIAQKTLQIYEECL